MSKRVERFRDRRARLDKRVGDISPPLADAELVQDILHQEIDWSLIDSVAIKMPVFNDVVVTDEDVDRCLSDLDKAFTRQKYDALFERVKDTLIDQIFIPLQLSRSDLMQTDRKFVYEDVDDYRKGFDSTRKAARKEATNEDGTTTDGYTGERRDPNEKMELDHVIPLKELHEKGGFMLNPEEKKALGNDPDNLVLTDQTTNRKKGDRPLEYQGLDGRRTRHIKERAEQSVEKQIPKGLDFTQRAAGDGIKTGIKQGQQQALAYIVSEFISAVFAEVKDVFENGWKGGDYNASWLESLKKRLKRIKRHLLNRWKGIAETFGTGWLSGFLSATITALLNMFVRTSKNIVRIIREGFLSIMKAIKVLLFPPEGMSLKQAAHEATKIFATGLIVTGGIMVGEYIATLLPMLGDIFGPVLGGLISGLGSLFVTFMLDKLDLFGVNFEERHAFIMGTLEDRISDAAKEIEDIEENLERIVFAPPPTG